MPNSGRNLLHALPAIPIASIVVVALATTLPSKLVAQPAQPAITLEKSAISVGAEVHNEHGSEPIANRPQVRLDYRDFGTIEAGHSATSSEPQIFTFDFHATTKLTAISSQGDFQLLPGGSCAEGQAYSAGDHCTVAMRFTPTAPGHRTGSLILAHSAAAEPLLTPVGGNSYASAVNFIPASISTVPSSVRNGVGAFPNIQGLATDGGGNLYISDSALNTVSYLDSTGSLSVIAGGGSTFSPTYGGPATGVALTSPRGVATNYAGDLFLADQVAGVVREVTPNGHMQTVLGGGTFNGECTYASPCAPASVNTGFPTGLASDPNGNIFVTVSFGGLYFPSELALSSGAKNDFFLLNSAENQSQSTVLAVDADDNLYFAVESGPDTANPTSCAIFGQNSDVGDGTIPGGRTWPVAGNRNCGFSGDGGPATGARIGGAVDGLAWDPAGDFYFTDTLNQVVRRIDAYTGIIHTIAGQGSNPGYSGDGGASTAATLSLPGALAVDSSGNVYTSSYFNNASEVIRKIGGAGQLVFLPQVIGYSSPAQTILVTDTGSAPLNLYKATLTSGNITDFSLDPVTTNCSFTVALNPGETCKIGMIFKPSAAGNRAAVLTLTDDTINGNDLIQVSGIAGTSPGGILASPTTLTFPAQQLGTQSAYANITLTQGGGLPVEFTTLSVSGANAHDFTVVSACPATLAVGASCVVQIAFTPSIVGTEYGNLNINFSNTSYEVRLSGTGVTTVNLSPTSLTFSVQTVNTAGTAQTITLKNAAKAAVGLTSYSISPSSSGFKVSGFTCPGQVAAGASCTFSITFTPPAAAAYTGTFTVITTAGTLTATLNGTGASNMSVAPATVTFTGVTVGAGVSQAVTITNSAKVPLTYSGFTSSASQFTGLSSCQTSIAAGAICSITVTFTPTYVGSIQSTLTINTGRGPLNVNLVGSAIAATPAVKLTSAANPAAKGEIIKLTTSVTNSSKDLPTGSVELLEGSAVLATETLVNGQGTFDLSGLSPGLHTLTSHYLGDKLHNPSTSSPLKQVVSVKIAPYPVLPVHRF